MTIKTGDSILHKPSGERWLVAYARNGYVCCCGWPETQARIEDCELLLSATPEYERGLLEELAELNDSRGAYARERLLHETRINENGHRETRPQEGR